MKAAALTFALIAASLAACSSEPAPTNEAANVANAAANAELENRVRTQMDDDRRLFQLADCSVAMEAVANTYETIARTGGDDRDELLALAAERDAAAAAYARQALELAERMGRPGAVDEIRQQRREFIRQEAERTRGDDIAFQAFLRRRGAAADNCRQELGPPPPA